MTGDWFAPPTSTTCCARSASPRSPGSGPRPSRGEIPFVLERAQPDSRVPAARSATTSRRGRTRFASSRMRASRSTSCGGSRRRRSSPGAHAGPESSEDRALFRAILLPLLARTAEACGGFDWEDGAFERVYGELERSLFGTTALYPPSRRSSASRRGAPVELGHGIRVPRRRPTRLLHALARGAELLPPRFGLEPERTCVLELERELPGEEERPPRRARPSSPTPSPRSGSRRRAPAAAGPVVFERLDWHPFGIRAAARDRRDRARGRADPARPVARAAWPASCWSGSGPEEDAELGEAVERWELRCSRTSRSARSGCGSAVAALLGGVDGLWAAAMRAPPGWLGGRAGSAPRARAARACGA